MAVADSIALRSGCTRRQAAAVIVSSDNRIVATGYNGPPASMMVPRSVAVATPVGGWLEFKSATKSTPATCSKDCPRSQPGAEHSTDNYDNCISLHAEQNALLYANRRDVEGGTLYLSGGMSCWLCGKLVAGSGIQRVVARTDSERDRDRHPRVLQLWMWCKIDFTPWDA